MPGSFVLAITPWTPLRKERVRERERGGEGRQTEEEDERDRGCV